MGREDISQNIKKEARAVQRRVVGFLIYYFFLILLGIALLVGVVFGTIKVLPVVAYLFYLSIRIGIVGVGVLLVVWFFAIRVGLFLIRPLFLSSKRDDSHRIEISSVEAPALFDMIADIAKKTGNKMPKHVFLTAEVNACVFYDKTSVWSIFFPPRKNLDIGIGLLHGMNVDEFKSILAHEFGHFSQNSMRVGTMSYRLLLIVNDMMMSTRDLLADDTGVKTLRFITESIVNRYNIVEKRNRSLSRYMEFEADGLACQLVSSKALISALCKLSPIEERHNLYSQMLTQALRENRFMQHYFRGYLFAYRYISEDEGIEVECDNILSQSVGDEALFPSRLIILNGWNTHPSLQERIDNALRYTDNDKEICLTAAETLIPEDLIDRVGRLYEGRIAISVLGEIIEAGGGKEFTDLDDTFEQWATQSLSEHRMPHFLYPFTVGTPNRDTTVNDDELPTEEQPYPFTQENRDLLIEYQHASHDMDTLNKIYSDEYDVEEMLYNNEYYTSAIKPIKIHTEYMKRLNVEAQHIGKQVYVYLLQCCNDDMDKKLYKCTCALLWLTAEALSNMSELYHDAHGMLEGVEHFRSLGRDVKINDEALEEVSTKTRKFMLSLDFDLLNAICGQWQIAEDKTIGDLLSSWRGYAENNAPLIGGVLNAVEEMWRVISYLYNVSNGRWTSLMLSAYREHSDTEQ